MLTGRYQIPKRRVAARAYLHEIGLVPITLFLSETAETHSGKEHPSDLLNGGGDFFAAESDDGRILFLNRRNVSRVAVADVEERDAVEAGGLDPEIEDGSTDVHVAVHLRSGDVVEGILHYALPEANRRIQDFLNGGGLFVPIRREGEIELVNTRHIVRVEPLQP